MKKTILLCSAALAMLMALPQTAEARHRRKRGYVRVYTGQTYYYRPYRYYRPYAYHRPYYYDPYYSYYPYRYYRRPGVSLSFGF